MPVKILIPTPLRSFVGGAREVEVEARTVGEALQSLIQRHAPLKKHLYGDDGRLRSFVNVYVNDEDVRYLRQGDTPVGERDVLSIVPSVAGGVEALPLSAEEIRRYSRHLIMPEVGMKGQVKLKSASVLLIGAGGLGSPLSLYLAAAGVGRIGIVDFDVVD
jgi:molybdopterin converting factor small subunit